ncbi:SprT-like domain-containing protein [Bacteroidota bacterium]
MTDLFNYIPETAKEQVQILLNNNDVIVKVVNQRQTKHGDFRKLKSGKYQITVNNNLNQHQFLLTLIHEIAHHVTHQKFGRVRPHGKEWKFTFKKLMLPFVHPSVYPNDILPHLAKYLINPKASTDSDVYLSLALKQQTRNSDKNYIFELKLEDRFILKKREFKILEKKRTRFLCIEVATGKKYLINQNAEVLLIA